MQCNQCQQTCGCPCSCGGIVFHPLPPCPPPPGTPITIVPGPNSIYTIPTLTTSQSNILPGAYINSFGTSIITEVGSTVTNPSFTATYSVTPTDAEILNTDNVNTPLLLSTPFNAGIVQSTFTHNVLNSSVVFTLRAIFSNVPNNDPNATIVQTATATITWVARSFAGVGAPGATSATANQNTAILNSGDGTLSDEGLALTDAGISFGPFFPHCQSVYVLVPHVPTLYTFTDQHNNPFQMNTPPTTFNFTNQWGIVVAMDLYQSTCTLDQPVTLTLQNPVVYNTSNIHPNCC